MPQKMIIFGSTGYFGSALTSYFSTRGWDVTGLNSTDLDLRNAIAVHDYITEQRPDVVINAAGATGKPNVDWCEENKPFTMMLNVAVPLAVAGACHDNNIYMVHLSSGCIYNGYNNGNGFSENDKANFTGSFYSRTKAYAEETLSEFEPLQLRIRIPIEGKPGPRNVIDKLKKYEKIISVENSFTILEDFLPAAEQLITKRARGIYNMTNTGSMDHEYLMSKYKEIVDPTFEYTTMTVDEMHNITKAKRSNCTLCTKKREQAGVHMPEIKDRIIEILHQYKRELEKQSNA